jgi:hypothetical protein
VGAFERSLRLITVSADIDAVKSSCIVEHGHGGLGFSYACLNVLLQCLDLCKLAASFAYITPPNSNSSRSGVRHVRSRWMAWR